MTDPSAQNDHTTSATPSESELNEQSVVDYLLEDKDFFTRHPKVLAQLTLPHQSGKTVSLVEHQVSILRERNMETRRRMNELIQAARTNDDIFAKTRSLTLALLEAQNLPALNEVLATHVLVDFEADFVCCHVIDDQDSLDHIRYHRKEIPFTTLLNKDHAVCTTLRRDELELIFPNSSHEDSGSAVIIPLQLNQSHQMSKASLDKQSGHDDLPQVQAVLCIGSRDAQRFSKDLDTLFRKSYIADVLAKVIR